jgi:hypothetical protein
VSVAAAAGRVLDLATHAGDITVEVVDGPPQLVAKLRLMARTEAEAARLLGGFSVAARETGDALVVRVEGEPVEIGDPDLRVRPLVSFHARVPPGQHLRAESGSGLVEVKGAAGDCDLQATFGDMKVLGVRGGIVRARTSSGSVQIRDVEARAIEVDTAFGDVRLEDVRGDLDVRAGSGDIVLAGFAEGTCEIETGFGDIDARGSFVDVTAKTSSGRVAVVAESGSRVEHPWSLQSSFGDVEVRVPQGLGFDLFAETSFGWARIGGVAGADGGRARESARHLGMEPPEDSRAVLHS